MSNGVLIIDKPQDWTSHDVVAKVRGILREKRVGHGGTLDPMATGVLPVFVGRATRAAEFATDGDKEYVARLRLGVTTDTQDATGTVLEEKPVPPDAGERLRALLPRFTGEIAQVPPMYSAIKQGGKKLYELARKGIEVERPARQVTIHALELLDGRRAGVAAPYDDPPGAPGEFTLRVVCSKGTYIRTLCHDLGAALGCGGCMTALRRTRVAGFSLAAAVTLEDLMAAGDPAALLTPVDACFSWAEAVTVTGEALRRAKNGNPFPLKMPAGDYRVYGPDGAFLLLGKCDGAVCRTVKSFFEV